MPIAPFEKAILRLLAANRNPESFVAGATILLRADDSHRRSQDIDFHDTTESLKNAAEVDGAALEKGGYQITWQMMEPTFRRALVARETSSTKLEWAFDSVFRFFPVEPDAELGYALNFWDGATNKVLALAGRAELRDYLDVLHLHRQHLSLGALAWAAAGKGAGYTPHFIVEEAQRLTRYPGAQLADLDLREPVDLVECKKQWLQMTREAFLLFDKLPAQELGCLYLDAQNRPVTPNPESPEFPKLRRHFGSVRGAWPQIKRNAQMRPRFS